MSSTPITLPQTSPLEQQKWPAKDPRDGPTHTPAAQHGLGADALKAASALVPITAELPADTPAILTRLASVVKEIASMDAMIAKAEASAPECPEARKWFEVSQTALVWSRENLTKEQRALLHRLKEQCLAQATAQPSPVPPAARCQKLPAQDAPAAAAGLNDDAKVVGSLRADLRKLQGYDDPRRCLLVRKIKRLGVDSAQKLRDHFQRAGAVTDVLVAHSFEKPSAKRRQGRVRPAAMGFVVMEDAAIAKDLVESGAVQLVQDGEELVEVAVEEFDPAMAASL